jgi:mannose/fructose/N-acetylgalactosamine-specific phosphotransferase system component IID
MSKKIQLILGLFAVGAICALVVIVETPPPEIKEKLEKKPNVVDGTSTPSFEQQVRMFQEYLERTDYHPPPFMTYIELLCLRGN